jgi:hypothetical protein
MEEFNIKEPSNAFYYFVLNVTLGLQDDEIEDAITDNNYLISKGSISGHDRGIDAVHIDESGNRPTIHLFNCKYTTKFSKLESNFPSGEIDKVVNFVNNLLARDPNIKNTVNPVLFGKIQEIWDIFNTHNPQFAIHLCSNQYHGLEKNEGERFEREMSRHTNFSIKFHLMQDFVRAITQKGKQRIDARLRAIDKNFFEKSDGDIRALIVNIDAKDLIRIVLNDADIRNRVDLEDFSALKRYSVLEDAFEDNVRVYLRQRSKINRNIKRTSLSSENHRFFYFNNGITITCESFEYIKTMRSPIIELKNIQVVNGSQTIHALYEAFSDDPQKFEYVDILCRIYETRNTELSTKIAEYTNSQNPVNSRDIRSIDYVQQKLEQEFLAKGLYYERKKGQYAKVPRSQRIDAERVGQVLLAFFQDMPGEAKNKKAIVFAEKYDDIFNDELTAEKVLLAYRLFERIEDEKNSAKSEIVASFNSSEDDSYILYSSYYTLYVISKLASRRGLHIEYRNIEEIWKLYPEAITIINDIAQNERNGAIARGENYSYAVLFKSNRPKKYIEQLLQ